jgi:hypothetical protein
MYQKSMGRLTSSTFTPQLVPSQPITTDDLERDGVFAQRVRLFGWIREKHLDVPEGEASQGFLGFAQQGKLVLPVPFCPSFIQTTLILENRICASG